MTLLPGRQRQSVLNATKNRALKSSGERTIEDCRDAIAGWLSFAGIQEVNGTGRGGIAGKLDENGRALFLYGEITGYWLRWASLYAPDPIAMRAAVDFLEQQWIGPDPALTRLGAETDWRNDLIFSFDLAMVLRGLADAMPVVGHQHSAQTADRIVHWLDRMIDANGLLQSHLVLSQCEVPKRWSTQAGPFQAKTAAAILQADHWLTPRLRNSAQRTLAHWRARGGEHGDLHPRFYAWEGHACAGGSIDVAAVMADGDATGMFPEQARIPGSPSRGDIQAQALRLLCLGGASDIDSNAVAASLIRHIQDDGSVRCHLHEPGANVWCALFAHQALDWFSRLRNDGKARLNASSII